MSYHPPGEFAHLFALRQDYLPNEALKRAVDTLFESGIAPDFLLHSTKEAYVDGSLYSLHKYEAERRQVHEEVQKRTHLQLGIGGVVVRRTVQYGPGPVRDDEKPQDSVRLTFLVHPSKEFDALNDVLDVYPDIYPRFEPPRHHLYVDTTPQRLVGLAEGDPLVFENAVGEFRKTMAEGIQKGLFAASVLGMTHTQKDVPMGSVRSGWRVERD